MENIYDHKEAEARISDMWEKHNCFTPEIDPAKKPFSIFLTPPNASGGMHIGNAFMIAIQDIMARYQRLKGTPTLWVPGTDHGGYETQVTFEKELEKKGKNISDYTNKELFESINDFVLNNNDLIKNQIKSMGASVDWARFRFTMDQDALESVYNTFKKMVSDGLIYRRPYMVHYCPKCSTILSDIELKENQKTTPLYFIKFFIKGSDDYLSLATTRPEFLFATTHLLIHPNDEKYSKYIGKILKNPINGNNVEIVASKRKFDPKQPDPFLSPFSPSYDKYDYEYTLRNPIPSRNLLDWNGKMIERYPGLEPLEARTKEVSYLKENDLIEKIDDSYTDSTFLCKSGHVVENLITLTWFLKLDDEKAPLRKPAIDAIMGGSMTILPRWREKGLLEWLGKMPDWPIARQNVWGIKIPIWYDVSEPSDFMVWFIDKSGNRQYGNLKHFLDQGIPLPEIENGLQRIYASSETNWTLQKKDDKPYLPETDTFDTWFSSGQWGTIVFDRKDSNDLSYFYPSNSIVIGHDLLRLSVSRKILLSQYLTGKLPFKTVYLHRLIKGKDGQKMSKSLGNAVSLEYYLDKFGADTTRMALISYSKETEDFIFSEDRLEYFKKFSERLLKVGLVTDLANQHSVAPFKTQDLLIEDNNLLSAIENLKPIISSYIEKFFFAEAQEKLCDFLLKIEEYIKIAQTKDDVAISLSVLQNILKKYLLLLHPFMPFMTEELYSKLYNPPYPLAKTSL